MASHWFCQDMGGRDLLFISEPKNISVPRMGMFQTQETLPYGFMYDMSLHWPGLPCTIRGGLAACPAPPAPSFPPNSPFPVVEDWFPGVVGGGGVGAGWSKVGLV